MVVEIIEFSSFKWNIFQLLFLPRCYEYPMRLAGTKVCKIIRVEMVKTLCEFASVQRAD